MGPVAAAVDCGRSASAAADAAGGSPARCIAKQVSIVQIIVAAARSLGRAAGRFADFKQVAIAADGPGYEGVRLPTGRSGEDARVLASSPIDATSPTASPSRRG